MATCRPTFNVKTLTVGFRPLPQTTRIGASGAPLMRVWKRVQYFQFSEATFWRSQSWPMLLTNPW